MKNFLMGLLLGTLGTYWYLTQSDYTHDLLAEMWARASSPMAGQSTQATRLPVIVPTKHP